MKKLLTLMLSAMLGFSTFVRADEGMWLPMLIQRLNHVDMQKMGLQLTADEIYSINHSSLKDAIVQFGGGCTGEIVSAEGLLFTNHHCGYGQIQYHSTVENNILENGFWAYSKEQELPCPGLSVKFLVSVDDVTGRILSKVNVSMSETERNTAIQNEIKVIINEQQAKNNNLLYDLKGFYQGNEFYLFTYEVFSDVRLVGAPPSAIGKFGADADNWMWPRHTGDFSIFRVYTNQEGKPADYSKENIPLKPKHFLPISLDGVQPNDFTMVMGYPGRTERFLTSYGINRALNFYNDNFVSIRQEKLNVYDEFMEADPAVKIQYAYKRAGLANYWKNYIGQSKQLRRNKVADKKVAIEKEFQAWANDKPEYKNVLRDIKDAYDLTNPDVIVDVYSTEAVLRGSETMAFAARYFSGIQKDLTEGIISIDTIKKSCAALIPNTEKFYKDYYKPLDMKLTAKMFEMFYTHVPEDQQPKEFLDWAKKNKGDFNKLTTEIYKNTIFADQDKTMAFIKNPTKKAIQNDAAIKWYMVFRDNYIQQLKKNQLANEKMQKAQRLFVAGLLKMDPNAKIAPDANSTMRLTYGKVLGYVPADATIFDYKTTMKGIMEKEDPKNPDFVVPDKLSMIYDTKDFGIYADKDGTMPVCFISDNDITGGNSGSPVINSKGELLGLAFDGNWEAMSGNIFFEEQLQRTISVDIRYVLLIIDKYAGAQNLIKELTLKKR